MHGLAVVEDDLLGSGLFIVEVAYPLAEVDFSRVRALVCALPRATVRGNLAHELPGATDATAKVRGRGRVRDCMLSFMSVRERQPRIRGVGLLLPLPFFDMQRSLPTGSTRLQMFAAAE